MKIRIERKTIPEIVAFIILIVNVSFFTIPEFSDMFSNIVGYHNKKMIFGITIALFVLMIFFNKSFLSEFLTVKGDPYGNLIRYFLLTVIVTVIISSRIYSGQNLLKIISNYYYYGIVLLYFIFIYWMRKKRDFCFKLCRMIVYLSAIYAAYMILSKAIYEIDGTRLYSSVTAYESIRNGTLRLSQSADFSALGAVIGFALWINKKNVIYLFFFILNTISVFWVGQTRMYEAAIIAAIAVAYLYCTKMNRRKMIVVILAAIVLCLNLGQIENYINSFSVNGIESHSTTQRLAGYAHYMGFAFSNGIIGMGLVSNNAYQSILQGTGRIAFSISDMGYTGYFGEFGILGILFIFFWNVLILKDIVAIKKHKKEKELGLVVCLYIFAVISFWSMIFNDVQRIVFFPLYMAIFAFSHEMIQNGKV